jgi:hypothetical protein
MPGVLGWASETLLHWLEEGQDWLVVTLVGKVLYHSLDSPEGLLAEDGILVVMDT